MADLEHRAGRRDLLDRDAPFVMNGWLLLRWPAFEQRWDDLVLAVEKLRERDPAGYKDEKLTRFLATVVKIVRDDVPSDPGNARYRQGRTLGPEYAHWRRAKFGNGRYRLFFRYSSDRKMIAYVWLNDENALRKQGARSDPYAVFRAMLTRGTPPTDWSELERACGAWDLSASGASLVDPSPDRS